MKSDLCLDIDLGTNKQADRLTYGHTDMSKDIHNDKQAHRHANRQTDYHTDKNTDYHSHKKKER